MNYSSDERRRDKGLRRMLFRPGQRPHSRYLLGRIEARLAMADGETFTVNAYPVQSRAYPGRKILFYQTARRASQSTLYRIRVRPKKCT